MYINTDQMVSMTEANRNFSKVAKMVEDKKEIIIMKNNKPRYVMMDYDEYDSRKSMISKVSDGQADYGNSGLINQVEWVSEDGMVKVPDTVQKALNTQKTRKIAFVEEGGIVTLMNPSLVALRKLQKAMEGKADELGLKSIDDVVALIKDVRKEILEEENADND